VTEANCAGPPDGYDEKALRASVMLCTTVRHDSRPSCTSNTNIRTCTHCHKLTYIRVNCRSNLSAAQCYMQLYYITVHLVILTFHNLTSQKYFWCHARLTLTLLWISLFYITMSNPNPNPNPNPSPNPNPNPNPRWSVGLVRRQTYQTSDLWGNPLYYYRTAETVGKTHTELVAVCDKQTDRHVAR